LVNLGVIKDLVLERTEMGPVTVHTKHKTKHKRKAGGGIVSIITEPGDKLYRITFFKKQRLAENTSFPFGYNWGE